MVLAPFFHQGGRYTVHNVHYVAEGGNMVPVSQTPFAKDATFGYKCSNLRDYVLEKAGSKFASDDIVSINIDDIRRGPENVTEKLLKVSKGSVIIVNAAAESDVHIFAAGILAAEQKGCKYIYRTGSYVPKTTSQLQSLRARRGSKLHVIELPVTKLVNSTEHITGMVEQAVEDASQSLQSGQDVLIMTSREIVFGPNPAGIEITPRYIIAKGGITSSDMARKGLKMKRAMVIGQAAGVPLWRCDEETSRHRGVPYVVFLENVGGEHTLAGLVERWTITRYTKAICFTVF